MMSFLSNIVSRLVAPRVAARPTAPAVTDALALAERSGKPSSSSRSRKSRDTTEYGTGMELTGVVSGIEHYGIFVRMPNGESGLVFQNAICWPGENITYSLGDKVDVMVVGFKPGRGLALSIRETRIAAAFEDYANTHRVGSTVQGQIKSVMDYGLFISLAPGVVGLLHVSAIPDIKLYGKSSIGEPINVCVVDIERNTRRVSLELG